jgi:hypothetical protein
MVLAFGDAQMKWIVSCFDSMVEQSSEHEPVTITFPSPLLSCLAGEEAPSYDLDMIPSADGSPPTRSDSFFLPSPPTQFSSSSPPTLSSPSSLPSPSSLDVTVSSLLPVGSTPPPVFTTLVSAGAYHTIPGFFHDDERIQVVMDEDDEVNPQSQTQAQAAEQQQQQAQQGGYMQELYNPSPPPSVTTPLPFLPSPLSAQDDFSWLLASSPKPIPSPLPFRYQD